MSSRTRAALGVLGASAAAGVAGDALLRETPWGLNLALFAAVFCALAAGLDRWSGVHRARAAWMAPVLAFGALAAWRDSPALKAIDLLSLGVILALAAHHARGGSVRLAGIARYAGATVLAGFDAVLGAAWLLGGTHWSEVPRRGMSRHAPAVLRGVLLAVPALLVFGSLLVSADAGFERLVDGLFRFDTPLAVSHVLLALLYAWLAAGAFRALHLLEGERVRVASGRPDALSLGATEVGMVLGTLNLLFAAFVAVQVRWLFGGAAVVAASPSLGYAEYARRGFFELVAVAGLVLPLLLALHWLMRTGPGGADGRLFRGLAGVQVALLYVIMASALRRMWLYQQAYGLTEMRVYATAFMLWLAAVFAWFASTVLRGRRDRFAFGALAAGLAAAAALHAVNPDALVVRVNAGRGDLSRRFDAVYAAKLSGDAVPALLAVLPRLPDDARCAAAARVARRWLPAQPEDWRAWSWGRSRALDAAAASRARLRATCPAAAAAVEGRTPAPGEVLEDVLTPSEVAP